MSNRTRQVTERQGLIGARRSQEVPATQAPSASSTMIQVLAGAARQRSAALSWPSAAL